MADQEEQQQQEQQQVEEKEQAPQQKKQQKKPPVEKEDKVDAQQQASDGQHDDGGQVHQQVGTAQQQEPDENTPKQQKAESDQQSKRSRSASRRARRQRIKEAIDSGKYMKTSSLEALEEADASGELSTMQTFERIGPDSTSMDGPVTKARAMRGEIPVRGSDPNQPRYMAKEKKDGGLADADGLKLTLEANLDVEIELKASIRGDLTLMLYQ